MAARMLEVTHHPATWIVSTAAATFAFWTCFGACVDTPPPDVPPQPRVIAMWEPVSCGEPHRVVLELEDDGGVPLSASAPCALGSITLDVPHAGVYRGRIYAWTLGAPIRSIAPVVLTIDQLVVRWLVETPR